jgi:Holliday junction resolvase-like predicted endonuclease
LGLEAEELVIQHFQKQNFVLRNRRLRTPFAELDLIFYQKRNPRELLIVEVKRLSHTYNTWRVLPRRQKQRLQNALQSLSDKGYLVEAKLALVDPTDKITEIPDFLS